jgi:hypothetical protein
MSSYELATQLPKDLSETILVEKVWALKSQPFKAAAMLEKS